MRNPVLSVFYRLKAEIRLRQLKRAVILLESEGFSVVRLQVIAGKTYIQSKSGSLIRVGKR